MVKVKEYPATEDSFILGLRESYPLDPDEIFVILRFLVVFSVGCRRYKIATNFDERLQMFIMDLHAMGYGQTRINSIVSSVCNYIRID